MEQIYKLFSNGYAEFHALLFFTIIGLDFIYLISNFYLQARAKKRLSDLIIKDGKNIVKKYNLEKFIEGDIDTSEEYEMLLFVLRKEINLLKEKTDKKILQKTLDRKNFNNQKRYAKEIFAQAGLIDALRLK